MAVLATKLNAFRPNPSFRKSLAHKKTLEGKLWLCCIPGCFDFNDPDGVRTI